VFAGKDDLTALHLAAAGGHIEVIQQLVAAGALLEAQTTRDSALRRAAMIAVSNGQCEGVSLRQMFDAGVRFEAQPRAGDTALHLALRCQQVEAVAQLIAAGSDVSAPDSNGWLPLHMATECADPAAVHSIVQQLVAAGADVDARSGRSGRDHCTPLTYACRRARIAAIEALRQAGAAAEAAEEALVQVTNKIITMTESAVGQVQRGSGGSHSRPVMLVGMQVVTALLAPVGTASTATAVGVNRTAPAGTAALVAAIEQGRPDVVKLLLQAGATVNATTAALGSTSRAGAAMKQADIVAPLLQSGAKDAVDSEGFTALMWAAASRSVGRIQALLHAGAAVNARSATGMTALHAAVMLHPDFSRPTAAATKSAVQALLAAGADASAAHHCGLTPLHICVRTWPASVSQQLLDAGAKVDACVRILEGEPAAAESGCCFRDVDWNQRGSLPACCSRANIRSESSGCTKPHQDIQ
jgi:ankyrin repeat protein